MGVKSHWPFILKKFCKAATEIPVVRHSQSVSWNVYSTCCISHISFARKDGSLLRKDQIKGFSDSGALSGWPQVPGRIAPVWRMAGDKGEKGKFFDVGKDVRFSRKTKYNLIMFLTALTGWAARWTRNTTVSGFSFSGFRLLDQLTSSSFPFVFLGGCVWCLEVAFY